MEELGIRNLGTAKDTIDLWLISVVIYWKHLFPTVEWTDR